MDLNGFLNLAPYVGGGLLIAGLYAKDGWALVKAWRGKAKPAAGVPSDSAPVDVGMLAENLKSIRVHCETVGDDEAAKACDVIAPTLFHERPAAEPLQETTPIQPAG